MVAPRNILILAKEPVEGRVKTRLCPPCTPQQAADVALAALADTLSVATACASVVLALDGAPGPWLPPEVAVIEQRGADFNERLANAWSDFGRGGIQIGMDTPHISTDLLDRSFTALDDTDAVLGPAVDGGWWAIGMHEPVAGVFDDVPMSTDETARRQLERMDQLGLATTILPTLTDIDHWSDALSVATEHPGTRTAAAVASVNA